MVKKVAFTRDDLELLLLAVHDKIEWCKNKADYFREYEDRDYMKDTEQEYKELQEVLINELRGF